MAEALYIMSKDRLGGAESFINNVSVVVINADDGSTAAARKALAAAAAQAATGSPYPATYFDTEQLITTASGVLGDAGDAYVIMPNEGVAKIKKEGP
jgi:hypothetical protein